MSLQVTSYPVCMHHPQKAQVLNRAYVWSAKLLCLKKKIHDHAYLNSDSAPSQQHNIPAYNQQGGKSSVLQYSLMLNNMGLLDFHTVQTQTN